LYFSLLWILPPRCRKRARSILPTTSCAWRRDGIVDGALIALDLASTALIASLIASLVLVADIDGYAGWHHHRVAMSAMMSSSWTRDLVGSGSRGSGGLELVAVGMVVRTDEAAVGRPRQVCVGRGAHEA
jgi:hypothetical protein